MIADLLFSVGITVLAVGVYLLLDLRYIPRRRVGILGKMLAASGSLTGGRITPKSKQPLGLAESGDLGQKGSPRLQSFGDVVYAFAAAMNAPRCSSRRHPSQAA